ncbi:hypothetical protein NP233_g2373 [Leucocoprinus birnbaumii]|uniref:Ankyrin n=1 Tax=Leucocoprinus birnbaumii TaxID=56174 RepID=A0AAD5YXC0_9AGAR|nr:hypothetical protein NP233_g2373 [Leucocoprinus birnbaumii]
MASPPISNRCDLHRAALNGDDEAVIRALETAADVNALDDEGRTPIMCAVAGDRWQDIDASDASFMTPKRLNAIRIMLDQPQITLHCLNAPHAATNGVIPLSMAAWLNFPQLVELLLEESADTVSVDGLDAHGATALMFSGILSRKEHSQLTPTSDFQMQHVIIAYKSSSFSSPMARDPISGTVISAHQSSTRFPTRKSYGSVRVFSGVIVGARARRLKSADSVKLSINACSESTVEELLSLARCSLPSLSKISSNVLIEPPPSSAFASTALSRSIKTIVSTLSNPPDIPFLRSLLFSPALPTSSSSALYPLSVPILVNRPDERGWSVIHHACSFTVLGSSSPSKTSASQGKIPEIEVLDILYLAGADVSLFTSQEHYTPLHILAKTSASVPSTISSVVKEQIRDFVTHLVRDLGAPLGARDKHDETCLHIAAEYGASKVVMDILLDLDRVMNDGRVSKMKNARGLLAAELVTKPELLDSFTAMKEKMDVATIRRGSVSSALSDNTLRGSEKHLSLAAVIVDELGTALPVPVGDVEPSDPLDIDPIEKTQSLLACMRSPMPTQAALDQMEATADALVKYFLAKIASARKEVDNAKRRRETVRANARALGSSLYAHSQPQAFGRKTVKKRKSWKHMHRESEDSQMTRVSSSSDVDASYVDVGIQTGVAASGKRENGGTIKAHGYGHAQGWTEWFEGLMHTEDFGTVRRKKDRKDKKAMDWEGGGIAGDFGWSDKPKTEKEKEKGTISGAHRFKNWWKKVVVGHESQPHSSKSKSGSNEKLASASMTRLELVRDIQDPAVCPVGRELKFQAPATWISGSFSSLALPEAGDGHVSPQSLVMQQRSALVLAEHAERQGEWMIGKALRTAPVVLSAVKKDLERIEFALMNAEECLKGAEANVERIGRVLTRALKKRRLLVEELARSRTSTPTQLTTRHSNVSLRRKQSRTSEGSPTSIAPSSPGSPGFLGYSLTLSLRPSYSSIASAASDCSIFTTTSIKTDASNVTVSGKHHYSAQQVSGSSQDVMYSPLGGGDDDETRTMRRLLLRRIEAQLRASYDEVDKVSGWISIVQDVVAGVKRRTYL